MSEISRVSIVAEHPTAFVFKRGILGTLVMEFEFAQRHHDAPLHMIQDGVTLNQQEMDELIDALLTARAVLSLEDK